MPVTRLSDSCCYHWEVRPDEPEAGEDCPKEGTLELRHESEKELTGRNSLAEALAGSSLGSMRGLRRTGACGRQMDR